MQRPSMIAIAVAPSLAACGGTPTMRVEPAPRMTATPAEDVPAAGGLREQTADEQVNHVLNRLTFGARPGDAEAVRAMGVDRWIDLQLHPERIDDSRSDAYFATLESYNTQPARSCSGSTRRRTSCSSACGRRATPSSARPTARSCARPPPARAWSRPRRRAGASTAPCSPSGSFRKS